MHTIIAHEHYSEYNGSHSIEHQEATSLVGYLALGFHHGSEKDLNESETTVNIDIIFKLTQHSFVSFYINSDILIWLEILEETDNEHIQQAFTHKYYKSNLLRAPPLSFI